MPFFLALGIGTYFSLCFEPSRSFIFILGGVGLFLLIFIRKGSHPFIVVIFGFLYSYGYTQVLNTQFLDSQVGPIWIKGEVLNLDHTEKGTRLTVRVLKLYKRNLVRTPTKIRVTFRGKLGQNLEKTLGKTISFRGVLMPPAPCAAPRSFNFRQKAYFDGLGAVGYSVSPAQIRSETIKDVPVFIHKLRLHIKTIFREKLQSPYDAIALALVIGERTLIPQKIQDMFAKAGMAHILAISGLHLSLIAGFTFFLVRGLISLVPYLALRYSSKKIAALCTLIFTFLYLLISGMNTPAVRAFMMTAIVLGAIFLNRVALTLRNVAFAAFFILLLYPYALLTPSFQLSFAAVTAIVSAYELKRGQSWGWGKGLLTQGFLYFLGILTTSFIAGLATFPYSVYHFHQCSTFGTLANLLAIPLTALWIMPSICLILGLGLPLYGLLETGLSLLVQIAQCVDHMPASYVTLAQVKTENMVLITVGALWICIWQNRWRAYGLIPLFCGVFIFPFAPQPQILVSPKGRLIGMHDGKILYVNSLRREKFVRELWKRSLGLVDHKKLSHVASGCTENKGQLTWNDFTLKYDFQESPHFVVHYADTEKSFDLGKGYLAIYPEAPGGFSVTCHSPSRPWL